VPVGCGAGATPELLGDDGEKLLIGEESEGIPVSEGLDPPSSVGDGSVVGISVPVGSGIEVGAPMSSVGELTLVPAEIAKEVASPREELSPRSVGSGSTGNPEMEVGAADALPPSPPTVTVVV
jgi:hypothetical protein